MLERAEPPIVRQPLDRRDLGSVGLDGKNQAGVDGAPVEDDRAGAALADEAALLRAGQPQVVAQHVEQGVVDGDLDGAPVPVDRQLDREGRGGLAHACASRSIATRRARAPRTRSIARR